MLTNTVVSVEMVRTGTHSRCDQDYPTENTRNLAPGIGRISSKNREKGRGMASTDTEYG